MTRIQWKMQKLQRKMPFTDKAIAYTLIVIITLIALTIVIPIATKEIQAKMANYENTKIILEKEKLQKIHNEKLKQKINERIRKTIEAQNKKIQDEIKERKNTQIYYFKKNYKINDHIKIIDMNRVVKEGDHYRFSIGDIDTIKSIDYENLKMTTYSNKTYSYSEQVQKIESPREWYDLVEMKQKGQLKFSEVNEDENEMQIQNE